MIPLSSLNPTKQFLLKNKIQVPYLGRGTLMQCLHMHLRAELMLLSPLVIILNCTDLLLNAPSLYLWRLCTYSVLHIEYSYPVFHASNLLFDS